MDNKKEISFGAFDSELMHQEIFIPEGFTATIEGDKIILKKTESEDERIRKALIEYFNEQCDMSDWNGVYGYQVVAWLEKQGGCSIKWNKNTADNKPQVNHSVLLQTSNGMAEGEWMGKDWLQYRWGAALQDECVQYWAELSDFKKAMEEE